MKRSVLTLALTLTLAVPPLAQPADACTTFCLRKGPDAIFGKNYDWHFDDGLVLVNKRGVAKTAAPPEDVPARWTSQYGSVTFNQFGREFPSGGMNEAGLVVELMWLDSTQYPGPGARPALSSLEWIQYQLDNYATVAEVARNAGGLRITSEGKLHFLVCDKGGSCATVEFLEGKAVVHSGATLPVPALTNHTYDDSLRFREANGRDEQAIAGKGSLQRFSRAAARAESFGEQGASDPVGYAFDTLDDVAQGKFTQWSIVYDLKAGRVYWRTRQNPEVRSVALGDFNFSCKTPVKMVDVQEGEGVMAGRFADYTPEANLKLVSSVYEKVRKVIPIRPGEVEATLAQPGRTACKVRR